MIIQDVYPVSGFFPSRIPESKTQRIPDSRIRICKTGFDADPNLDPTFHFVCRSRSGSYPKFYTCWKIRNLLLFTAVAVYIVFIYLIGVIGVKNILYFWQYIELLKFSGKKHAGILALQHWLNRSGSGKMVPFRPDPDPQHWFFLNMTSRYQHTGIST